MNRIQALEREMRRLEDKMEILSYKLDELHGEMLEQDIQGFWPDQWYGPDPAVEAEYRYAQLAYEDAVGQWQAVINELYHGRFMAVMRELVAHGGRRGAWQRRGAAVNAWYARRQKRAAGKR